MRATDDLDDLIINVRSPSTRILYANVDLEATRMHLLGCFQVRKYSVHVSS